jgi:hypothetical protein
VPTFTSEIRHCQVRARRAERATNIKARPLTGNGAQEAVSPIVPEKFSRIWSGIVISFLVSLAAAHGQHAFLDQNTTASVSGQFLVSNRPDDPPAFRPENPAPNTNVVRLKTALLAVSAERFKTFLWRQLGIQPGAAWSGKIYFELHPAASLDESVTIASSQFLDHWNYEVSLPDMLWKTRYARALASVLLLELANRSAGRESHAAEVPAWLVDGLAQQVLAAEGEQVILSAPRNEGGEVPVNRANWTERGIDSLAEARRILQNTPALTFDQLSWPTDWQMEGADGGVYYASAELFQAELLDLKNGREKVRAMLSELPAHQNWQTAFFQAFGEEFRCARDVEKWWALRVVDFVQRAPGPHWTTEVSIARLEDLLQVPVETRTAPDALPAHAEISLQAALKNLPPEEQDELLRVKVRDLALTELRLAAPFAGLADGYRVTLADYLGELKTVKPASVHDKHAGLEERANLMITLKRLTALDARRLSAENRLIPVRGETVRASQ